jgi:hypothetical protein
VHPSQAKPLVFPVAPLVIHCSTYSASISAVPCYLIHRSCSSLSLSPPLRLAASTCYPATCVVASLFVSPATAVLPPPAPPLRHLRLPSLGRRTFLSPGSSARGCGCLATWTDHIISSSSPRCLRWPMRPWYLPPPVIPYHRRPAWVR